MFDNLTGRLALQVRSEGSHSSCPAEAPLRHGQLFNLQAWANHCVTSASLGRDLHAFTHSNGISLTRAIAHARRCLPHKARAGRGFGAGPWLQARECLCRDEHSGVSAPDLPLLAKTCSDLPPCWGLCRAIPTA